MAYQRNHTLEMLKLFAAYMVVFLHVPFYGEFGVAVNALARFAVPFFFLVSGFFSYGITMDKIKRRIAHLVFLLIFAILLCTVANVSMFIIKQDFRGIAQHFKQYLDFEKVLHLLLFNKTIQVEYLWYLFAILYVYILLFISTAFGMREKLYWVITLITLFLQLFLGEFLSFYGIVLPNYTLRNFALMGIPFFGLGMMANKYKDKMSRIPNSIIVILIILGMLETLFSRFRFGLNEVYIGSVFIIFSLAVIFIKYPNMKSTAALAALTGCNTYIYILHPIVSVVIINLFVLLGVHSGSEGYITLRMIHPLLVCVVSTVLAYAANKILHQVENKIKYGGTV